MTSSWVRRLAAPPVALCAGCGVAAPDISTLASCSLGTVPVQIEANELLFTIRSDNAANVWDVLAFLGGSDMLAGMGSDWDRTPLESKIRELGLDPEWRQALGLGG